MDRSTPSGPSAFVSTRSCGQKATKQEEEDEAIRKFKIEYVLAQEQNGTKPDPYAILLGLDTAVPKRSNSEKVSSFFQCSNAKLGLSWMLFGQSQQAIVKHALCGMTTAVMAVTGLVMLDSVLHTETTKQKEDRAVEDFDRLGERLGLTEARMAELKAQAWADEARDFAGRQELYRRRKAELRRSGP